jgi:hypothetical protein
MTRLSILGRLLPILGLVGATIALGASSADAQSFARPCAHPRFVTSGTNGGTTMGRYYVHNNMWNVSGYNVSETLKACSAGNWYVNAKADNSSGDGAVKTYPNVHRDYHGAKLSSFKSIKSKFASRSPHVGIYNGAYDIWMNGVASSGSTEVMIWTDNYRQVPAGSIVKRGLRFSHRTWKLWATSDHRYLAFKANKPLHHGTIAVKKRLSYLVRHGYLNKGSTVGQICFGYEIVSTGGTFHRFKIDRFSIRSPRK